MADSNLPPSSTPPRTPAPNLPPRADGQAAQVTDVSGDLRAVPRPARLAGEVIQSNPDGRIRVKTDRGEIEMTVRGRGDIPEKGERVEVDIAPGRPPRQAVVRELPPETKPAPPRSDVPQQPTTPPRGEIPRVPVDTPVRVEVPPVVVRPAPQPLPQAPVIPPRGLPPPILAPSEPLPDLPPAEALPVKQQAAAAPLKALSGWISLLLPQKITPPAALPAAPPVLNHTVEEPLRTGDIIRLLSLPAGTEKNILSQPVAVTPMVMDLGDAPVADTITRPVTAQKAAIISANTQAANPEGLIPDNSVRLAPPQGQEVKPGTGIKTILESLKPVPAGQVQDQLPPAQFQPQPQVKAAAPEFRVLKIDPPLPQAVTQNISIPSGPQIPAGAVQAKVTGFTPQNFPVLSMITPQPGAEGFFALPLVLPDIAEGFTLTLMPQGQSGLQSAAHLSVSYTPGAPLTPPSTPMPVFADSMIWPALDDLAQAVKQADSRAYQSMMQTIIPNAGNPGRLPAAALLFISVVASGDIAAWMGEKTIDVLRRAGRMDVIGKLSSEMGSVRRAAQEPVSGDWRAMTLPMAWQDEIARMMLYYRHDQGPEREDGTRERITRFMFDLNLTKMGPVQIDGFHKTERLDLIVRTKTPLSIEMQKTMRRAYASALENSRLFGELAFQNKPEQFLKLAQDPKNKPMSA